MTTTNGKLNFLFECSDDGGWVKPLGDSTLVKGYIASQNAGSINTSMYYQVDGGGMNGIFAGVLQGAGQLDDVNGMLKLSYENIYGKGEWAKDSVAGSNDRLTSMLIELIPGKGAIGSKVIGMMYSVGPILGSAGITDEAQYRQIYTDALMAIAGWNDAADPAKGYFPIGALRITMLSCGIYSNLVTDLDALVTTSAKGIIQGLCNAAKDPVCKSAADTVILVNVNDKDIKKDDDRKFKERDAFTKAAKALGITVTAAGFSVDY